MRLVWILLISAAAFAQPPAAAPPKDPKAPTEDGIPVTSQLVVSKCSACHRKDEKGNLSRISWERTTPEGWQQAIKRMVRLNGLTLSPDEARQIVKYFIRDISPHGEMQHSCNCNSYDIDDERNYERAEENCDFLPPGTICYENNCH